MLAPPIKKTSEATWLLSGQLTADQPVRSFPVASSPFLVGRHGHAALTLPCGTVSGVHAELRMEGGELIVKDLGSTNGTFVNGARLDGECVLRSGDLLQFAEVVFRVALDRGHVEARTIAGDASDR